MQSSDNVSIEEYDHHTDMDIASKLLNNLECIQMLRNINNKYIKYKWRKSDEKFIIMEQNRWRDKSSKNPRYTPPSFFDIPPHSVCTYRHTYRRIPIWVYTYPPTLKIADRLTKWHMWLGIFWYPYQPLTDRHVSRQCLSDKVLTKKQFFRSKH